MSLIYSQVLQKIVYANVNFIKTNSEPYFQCKYFRNNRTKSKKINFIIINQNKIFSFSHPKEKYKQILNMLQNNPEPVTHSLLRNSQVRKKQQTFRLSQSSRRRQTNQATDQNTNKQKYHFNYSKSHLPRQNKRPSITFNNSYELNQPHYFNNRQVPHFSRQTIIVCNSLPKTKPRYSFTFDDSKPLSGFINKNTCENVNVKGPTNNNQNQRPRSVRKDLDMCLYTITDKLKELQSRQNTTEMPGKNFQGQNYRPSLTQLRKSNKMFIQKNIHRIQPQLINNYIETVYKDYNIPDPLRQTTSNYPNPEDKQEKPLQSLNVVPEQRQQVSFINNYNRFPAEQVRKPLYPFKQQDYLSQIDKKIRKNNLITQKQRKKDKNAKRRFLNLTLSKQKPIEAIKFDSPIKNKVNYDHTKNDRQIKPQQDLKRQELSSQRSKSKELRQSSSQKNILDIKKNISSWNDSQHQYAERYSYLLSPYEIIQNKSHHRQDNQGPLESNRPVNVHIRPFQQLMKVNIQNQSQFIGCKAQFSTINKNTTISQLMQSKYHQSFFTQQGQIMQDFRYCVLCEMPILSANIYKHQQKCIGWIHGEKLYNFKELYSIDAQEQLKIIMNHKIQQIRTRIISMIQKTKHNECQKPDYSKQINQNILQSVQNFILSYKSLEKQGRSLNTSEIQNFNSSFKKVQKNYKNPYILLMEESTKLHWFIKLLQNYERRNQSMSKSINQNQNDTNKRFSSTKQRHDNSQTFIQEESFQHQVISEFPSQNFSLNNLKDK